MITWAAAAAIPRDSRLLSRQTAKKAQSLVHRFLDISFYATRPKSASRKPRGSEHFITNLDRGASFKGEQHSDVVVLVGWHRFGCRNVLDLDIKRCFSKWRKQTR